MRLSTEGPILVDEQGRQRVLHGISLVAAGRPGGRDAAAFRGDWSDEDLARLAAIGLDAVRLGVVWAAVEPVPGRYDEEHLGGIREQLDRLHTAGLAVVLTGHQDLYSQRFGAGAPDWATLTRETYAAPGPQDGPGLSSAAVQESWDAFWADAPGDDGTGIRTRFAAMWGEIAARFGDHPAVVGYDILHDPAPGSVREQLLSLLQGSFADITRQHPDEVGEAFADPDRRPAQLDRLQDPAVHRRLGDDLAPALAPFERGPVHDLYADAVPRIREHDPAGLILREHSRMSSIGVPAEIIPLPDDSWAYSPHGQDLVLGPWETDQHDAVEDRRSVTAFERAAETGERLGVPVVVGAWGAFGEREGVAARADEQLDLFDRSAWSWFYWRWEEGFATSEAAERLRRPRPVAIAGRDLRSGVSAGGSWKAAWTGRAGEAPSELWIPEELDIELRVDGERAELVRDGARVTIPAADGDHRLRVS